MSIEFNGSTSKLVLAGQRASAYPVALFAWIKPDSAGASGMVFGHGGAAANSEEFMIYADGAGDTKVKAFERTLAAGSLSVSSTSALETNWQPVLAVFNSSTDRKIYYKSGAAVSASDNSAPFHFSELDRLVVGCRGMNDSLFFDGLIAEVAMWTGTVPDSSDWTSLSGGIAPSSIKNASIVGYWPLLTHSGLTDSVHGLTFTATSLVGTGASHPTITAGSPVSARGGVAWSSISAINGITKSGISAINGITL